MAPRSRYDELHDHYQAIQTTKRGTRYERLAAVVFSALDRSNVVIHDLKALGQETAVEHQIDVHIEQDGRKRRILVECKDFDISGAPVGLGIVRDFWGVVDDVHPDEAWIITCNDFTDEAKRYAKGKGIKLATLRVFADADWANRVRTMVVNIDVRNVRNDKMDLRINMSDEDGASFTASMARLYPNGVDPAKDTSRLFDGVTTRSISCIGKQIAASPSSAPNDTEVAESKHCTGWVSVDGVTRYPINGFRIAMPVKHTTTTVTISAVESAAKLLLTDDSGLDFVLWDQALEGFTIDGDGKVHLADEAVQKRLTTTITTVPSAIVDAISQARDANDSESGSSQP